ncbi:hypothetical protein EJB05_34019, partial [Eragrostis curvula]
MGRSSGKKRAAVLGFLGLTAVADEFRPSQEYQQCHVYTAAAAAGSGAPAATKVRPSDDDGYAEGRPWWYAERDIDRRASEFIDRVHRGMLAGAGDGSSSSAAHY